MTVLAQAWAFKQRMPPIPHHVLLVLADQADDETGRVCYGRTNLDHIAWKANVSKRSIYRYIGALVRNGYLVCESGAERGQPNQYWLQLDRMPTHADDWQWFDTETCAGPETDGEPETPVADDLQDIAGGGANLAPPETGGNPVENPEGGVPPVAQGVCHTWHPQDSLDNQSTKATPRIVETKSGFSKRAQDLDRANLGKEREKAKPAQYFVIEGTRAWEAWIPVMRKRTGISSWNLTVWATVDGKNRRGWYFPSLFPPSNKPTAPPGELSDEDARALAGM